MKRNWVTLAGLGIRDICIRIARVITVIVEEDNCGELRGNKGFTLGLKEYN